MQTAAEALADLPLPKRAAAARRLIEASLGMTADERAEVLSVAVWPELAEGCGSIIAAGGD